MPGILDITAADKALKTYFWNLGDTSLTKEALAFWHR